MRPSSRIAARCAVASLVGIAGALLACSRPAPRHDAPAPAAPASARRAAAQLATGRQVVQTVCLTCHTEQPPMKAAPPFAMIAMHYRGALPDSAAAVARIAGWVRAPARERSLLPPMAVERFGVMPPFVLPDSLLEAAAVYVLSLEHQGMQGMQGMHDMRGMHEMKPGSPMMRPMRPTP